jgi:hypothetical protein
MWAAIFGFFMGRTAANAALPDSVKQERYDATKKQLDARAAARAKQKAKNRAAWATPFGRFVIWLSVLCVVIIVVKELLK